MNSVAIQYFIIIPAYNMMSFLKPFHNEIAYAFQEYFYTTIYIPLTSQYLSIIIIHTR